MTAAAYEDLLALVYSEVYPSADEVEAERYRRGPVRQDPPETPPYRLRTQVPRLDWAWLIERDRVELRVAGLIGLPPRRVH